MYLVSFQSVFYLLFFFLSQSVKDLNHLLRGVLDGDVSSNICMLFMGCLQICDFFYSVANF